MSLQKVREIIENSRYGQLATSVDGQPHVRPMAFIMLEDGRLWSSTYECSGKMDELRKNDKVEICFVDKNRVHLRIEGLIDISGDCHKKDELLKRNPKVNKHFDGGQDPNFVHLEVRPLKMKYKPMGFCEYTEVTL